MSFDFSIVELPKMLIAGINIQTDMSRAGQDCPALWMTFGERVAAKLHDSPLLDKNVDCSYGISIMQDEMNFVYWAGCAITAAEDLPEGIDSITLPAGSYVTCTVPNLAQLGQALNAMYCDWPTSQDKYQIDMAAACFECYPLYWETDTAFSIFAKVQVQA